MLKPFTAIIMLVAIILYCTSLRAQTSFRVINKASTALSNIVVEIRPVNSNALVSANRTALIATIEQNNQQFVPHISVVPVNTEITFPNIDSVQHHVYSFSPAKTFEVSLREEFTSAPIKFEESGIVELGCNIHDWMLAYVYVSDAPWLGQTGSDGTFPLNLPLGEYQANIWHPRFTESDIKRKTRFSISADSKVVIIALRDQLLPSLSGYDSVEAVDVY